MKNSHDTYICNGKEEKILASEINSSIRSNSWRCIDHTTSLIFPFQRAYHKQRDITNKRRHMNKRLQIQLPEAVMAYKL